MTARKCKVCDGPNTYVSHEWCAECRYSYDNRERVMGRNILEVAAEWGAKRRADAARKAGGK